MNDFVYVVEGRCPRDDALDFIRVFSDKERAYKEVNKNPEYDVTIWERRIE